MDVYPVNTPIKVRIVEVSNAENLVDLTLIATNPVGGDSSPILMVHIGGGIYEGYFTPDSVGRWLIRIVSSSTPDNNSTTSVYVGDVTSEGKVRVETYQAEGTIATVSLIKFFPRFYHSKEEIVLLESDTLLASQDKEGKIDSIDVTFDRDDVEFILSVDNIEVLRISLEDLNSPQLYDNTHVESVVRVTNNGKHVSLFWRIPVDFNSNFSIKAKKMVSGTTKMLSCFISYREKLS